MQNFNNQASNNVADFFNDSLSRETSCPATSTFLNNPIGLITAPTFSLTASGVEDFVTEIKNTFTSVQSQFGTINTDITAMVAFDISLQSAFTSFCTAMGAIAAPNLTCL